MSMKKVVSLSLFLIALSIYKVEGQEAKLGVVERNDLKSTWFSDGYEQYEPQKKLLRKFKRASKKYKVKVVMGTWCPDSRFEVPRFYKILDALKYPDQKTELIFLNRRKKDPSGLSEELNIRRVPTFIFYKNDKEVGRIVEHPKGSLEEDIAEIVK